MTQREVREPVITKKEYDWWVDGVKHKYIDYKKDKQDLMICKCGNKTFWIFQGMSYETDAICTECRKSYCVHDG